MANFCGKCGGRLDEKTGLCPRCQSEKIVALGKKKNEKRRVLKTLLLLFLVVLMIAVGMFIGFHITGSKESEAGKEAAAGESNVREGNTAAIESAQASELQKAETEPKAIVTDAYFDSVYLSNAGPLFPNEEEYTCYYHVPKINLDLPGIEQVNEQIYDELYYEILAPDVLQTSSPKLSRMAYFYTVKGDILSILVCVYDRFTVEYFDEHQYYSYNISMETGKLLPDKEVVDVFGLTFQRYKDMARQKMKEMSDELYRDFWVVYKDDNYYVECLKRTLSEENLWKNQLYIDPASGDLCTTARISRVDGTVSQEYSFNITGTTEPVDPAAYRDISQEWDGTEKIWRDLTDQELEEIRKMLGVPDDCSPSYFVYTPEYWQGGGIWRRYVEIGVDGKLVASAYVTMDPVNLAGAIMMYYPSSTDPFVRYEESSGDLSYLEGTWKLDESEDREAEKTICFRSDGMAVLTNEKGTEKVVPYSQYGIESCLIFGDEKRLFSLWEPVLYLFEEGEKENPLTYYRAG